MEVKDLAERLKGYTNEDLQKLEDSLAFVELVMLAESAEYYKNLLKGKIDEIK